MGRLIYAAITSLDGYIEDLDGRFDWSQPAEEEHAFINDLTRPVGTHLYGRRMYEVMKVWESPEPAWPGYMQEFAAIWQAGDKVVYSTTLERVSTERTRLERGFDAEAIRQLKASSTADIAVSGPELAGHAIRAGLVDEYQVFLSPIVVGGGKHWLPPNVGVRLDLLDERRFSNGVVYLRYGALDIDAASGT
jgi:dihydrofolate reductase